MTRMNDFAGVVRGARSPRTAAVDAAWAPWRWIAAASLMLAGCAPDVPPASRAPVSPTARLRGVEDAPVAAVGASAAVDPAPAPAVRPAEVALARADLARLDPASRAALSAFGRPVLLLDPALPIERGRITSGEVFLAQSVPTGERTYALQATATATALPLPSGAPLPARPHRVRGRPATVTTNEGIVSVAFEEDGLAYVLEVECVAPETDPACTDDAAIRALAERLVRAGGSP